VIEFPVEVFLATQRFLNGVVVALPLGFVPPDHGDAAIVHGKGADVDPAVRVCGAPHLGPNGRLGFHGCSEGVAELSSLSGWEDLPERSSQHRVSIQAKIFEPGAVDEANSPIGVDAVSVIAYAVKDKLGFVWTVEVVHEIRKFTHH
jgi:hypothetical protein